MSAAKKVLILCSDNYHKQPRVIRTIQALQNYYDISVAGFSDAEGHELKFIDLVKNTKLNKSITYSHFNKPFYIKLPVSFYYKYIKQKQFYRPLYFEQQYWTTARKADLDQLNKYDYNVIISHGIDTLPLALKIGNKKIPVIFNAHEYYPLEFEQDQHWKKTEGERAEYIIKKYLSQCAMMFCVSESIQNEYRKNANINSIVITNATSYKNLSVIKTKIPIKIIHHGAAIRARQIEIMADMMDYLNGNYILHFMLVPTDKKYLEELKLTYGSKPRIKFIEPVSVSEIPLECNKYDIGLFILPPVNFNWLNALPNKFFEYVQGRLAIAVSPNPDMKYHVEKYNLGIVSENYSAESMAKKISELNINDIDYFKQNAHTYAMELSAENNQKKILQTINSITGN